MKNSFYKMQQIRAESGNAVGRIDFYGEISSVEMWGNEVTPKKFRDDLLSLGKVSGYEVHVFSNGGCPFSALAIYAIMSGLQEPVNVYVDGIAASAATLILCAGNTVYMDETSMLMVHNPYQLLCFAGLNAKDARELADELDKIREPMITAYMKKSSKTRDEVIALMDGETGNGTWLTAAEAIEFGLADAYTPENKKPLEVAALISPGVYNYRGHKIDLTNFEKAAEKTAGKINARGGNSPMAFWNKKKKQPAKPKKETRAEITFVEMVCPSCSGAVYLNQESGETFAGGTQTEEPDDNGENTQASATLARRMPGNVRAEIYTVDCPHCGNEFIWDTDAQSDGEQGQQATDTAPIGGSTDDNAQDQTQASSPSAEAATAVCSSCGAQVGYDTATAETGTDAAGTEGYLLTCASCNTQFVEPYPASDPGAVPVGAAAQAAYRAGVQAERRRILALDEMQMAAPGAAAMIQAAKRSGTSVETMGRNVIKALAAHPQNRNMGAGQFAAAQNRDFQASGVNQMRTPQHAAKPKSIQEAAYERYAAEYNKGRGGKSNEQA